MCNYKVFFLNGKLPLVNVFCIREGFFTLQGVRRNRKGLSLAFCRNTNVKIHGKSIPQETFASWPRVHSSDNALIGHYILWYTNRLKGFTFAKYTVFVFLVFTWRHQILEFKTGRPTKFLPSIKEKLPKKYVFSQFLSSISYTPLENKTIFISEFSSCVTSERRPWQSSSVILKMTPRVIFSILNNLSLKRNIYLNTIGKFTRKNKPLSWQKWTPDVFSYFRPPCWCPSEGHQHGVSLLGSIN